MKKRILLAVFVAVLMCAVVCLAACFGLTPAECTHANKSWQTKKAATCTEAGSQEEVCADCQKVLNTKEIPKLSHSLENWVCSSCQNDYKQKAVEFFQANIFAEATKGYEVIQLGQRWYLSVEEGKVSAAQLLFVAKNNSLRTVVIADIAFDEVSASDIADGTVTSVKTTVTTRNFFEFDVNYNQENPELANAVLQAARLADTEFSVIFRRDDSGDRAYFKVLGSNEKLISKSLSVPRGDGSNEAIINSIQKSNRVNVNNDYKAEFVGTEILHIDYNLAADVEPHECAHICPECGKCTDSECQNPLCADKCQGHIPQIYTVIFNANGGVFEDGTTQKTVEVQEKTTVEFPDAPTKTGMEFAGWVTEKNGTVIWQATDKVTADTTLWASYNLSGAALVSVEGATITDDRVLMLVPNNTESVSLASKVTVSNGAIWRLFRDKLGQVEIPTKIAAGMSAPLAEGDNLFYIVVQSSDATLVNVYELNIHLMHEIAVTYYDGETVVKTVNITSGQDYSVDQTITIKGYTIDGWQTADEVEFSSDLLLADLELFVQKTAKTFTVTIDPNGGTAPTDTEMQVTFDEKFVAPRLVRENYIFAGYAVNGTIVTDDIGRSLSVWNLEGDATLVAQWTGIPVKVNFSKNLSGAGEVLGLKNSYRYNDDVAVFAMTNKGYVWCGWYNGNNELVSDQVSFSFKAQEMPILSAKWEVVEAYNNFEFTSTQDHIKITRVKSIQNGTIVFPDDVDEIASGLLSGGNYTSITMPSVINWLGALFKNSATIETLVLTYGNISQNFVGKVGIENLVLAEDISGVGENAFKDCSKLKSVTILSNNAKIAAGAFEGCLDLVRVNINNLADWCGIEFANEYSNPLAIAHNLYLNGELVTKLEIPSTVTEIKANAFAGLESATEVVISDSVTSIAGGTFYACNKIEKMTVPFVGGQANATRASSSTLFGYIFGTKSYDGGTSTTQYCSSFSSSSAIYYIPSSLRKVTITGGNILYGAFS